MLTPYQQLQVLREVRNLMAEENWTAAGEHLLALIRATPSESAFYAVMVGCANWLISLNQPWTAARQLAQFLLTLPAEAVA